ATNMVYAASKVAQMPEIRPIGRIVPISLKRHVAITPPIC
ncbi:MAG: hypothetical protein QG656_1880, partial [Candidatus Hydrogenedentes bacterium]|nr:hypothetical protein [Candidatus Hydrogenedentota bacterium]